MDKQSSKQYELIKAYGDNANGSGTMSYSFEYDIKAISGSKLFIFFDGGMSILYEFVAGKGRYQCNVGYQNVQDFRRLFPSMLSRCLTNSDLLTEQVVEKVVDAVQSLLLEEPSWKN